MASRNSLDMTQGPVLRTMLLFAYPLMLNRLINSLYNAVDKAIAGQFIGPGAMAAVGACTSPTNLVLGLFIGVASGVSVVCGGYLGGHRKKELRETMHSAPITGFLCGLFIGLIGLLFSGLMLRSTGTPDDVFGDALTYMTIYMLGAPIQFANNFCVCILNAHGDTKRTTVAVVVGGLMNVMGNLLFVVVIHLGVCGIALSTILSQAVSLSINLVILFNPRDNYQLKLSELRLHWKHIKKIFAIGLPAGINTIAFSFSNVLLQSSVNSFGSVVMAGNSAADSLLQFVLLIPAEMNTTASCAVAQCYGAEKVFRIHDIVKKGILGALLMVAAASTLMTVLSQPLMMLFADDPAVATAGIPKLLFAIWGYLPYCFCQVYSGALNGIQKTRIMMLMALVGICLPRVLWVWFVLPFFATPTMLYLIYPISCLISAVLLGIVYRRNLKRLMQKHEHTGKAL